MYTCTSNRQRIITKLDPFASLEEELQRVPITNCERTAQAMNTRQGNLLQKQSHQLDKQKMRLKKEKERQAGELRQLSKRLKERQEELSSAALRHRNVHRPPRSLRATTSDVMMKIALTTGRVPTTGALIITPIEISAPKSVIVGHLRPATTNLGIDKGGVTLPVTSWHQLPADKRRRMESATTRLPPVSRRSQLTTRLRLAPLYKPSINHSMKTPDEKRRTITSRDCIRVPEGSTTS